MPSKLENNFGALWKMTHRDIAIVDQFKFAPGRRFRFDFAHVASRTAIELDGILSLTTKRKSRHQTFTGFNQDCDKLNLAAELGWVVLRYTQWHLRVDPIGMADQVARVIQSRDGNDID